MSSISPIEDRAPAATSAGAILRVSRKVAVANAQLRSGAWSALSPMDRGRLLDRLADLVDRDAALFGAMASAEHRPASPESTDAAHAAAVLRAAVGWAHSLAQRTVTTVEIPGARARSFATLRPMGVVAVLMSRHCALPFIARKVAALLAAGCTVIIKPSERMPDPALHFSSLCREAGFPGGVVDVAAGRGDVEGRALCEHPGVALVSFAGGAQAALEVRREAARQGKAIALEVRGVHVQVVLADAVVEDAASGCAAALLPGPSRFHAASRRVFVQRGIAARFAAALASAGVEVASGEPAPAARQPAEEAGATDPALEPAAGRDVSIVEFETEDEALVLVDRHADVSGVTFWTASRQCADRLVEACRAPAVNVNCAGMPCGEGATEVLGRIRSGSAIASSPALAYVSATVVTVRSGG